MEPTPNLWPNLYRKRLRNHKRLKKALKSLRLAIEDGHLVDSNHPRHLPTAKPLVYSAIVLVEMALKTQLATEGISWKPDTEDR